MSTPVPVPRTVSVTGEGRAPAPPDVATLQLGVETLDAALAAAQADNTARVVALREGLRAAGVPAADIRTLGFQVGQDYGSAGPMGYRVTHNLRVTVRDLERVGALLDAAIAAGANRVHRVEFGLRDEAAVRGQARAAAMRDATAKAEQYAALAAARRGPVLNIAEDALPARFLQMSAVQLQSAGAPPPIDPGESTIVVRILVTYALLPADADEGDPRPPGPES